MDSPEMIQGMKYNGLMKDVWSSWIILFAMLFWYLSFELKAFFKAKDLIMGILNLNPNERIELEKK